MDNEELALALLRLHIVDLLDFINPSRTMSLAQVDQTADLILIKYPTLKIADLVYIFNKAKAGEFGVMYEGIDGMKILSWINQVFNERCEAGEAESVKDHDRQKKELEKIVGTERATNASIRDIMESGHQVNDDEI